MYLQECDEISSVNVTANGGAQILQHRPANKYNTTTIITTTATTTTNSALFQRTTVVNIVLDIYTTSISLDVISLQPYHATVITFYSHSFNSNHFSTIYGNLTSAF